MVLTVVADDFASVKASAAGDAPACGTAPRRSLTVLIDIALTTKRDWLATLS